TTSRYFHDNRNIEAVNGGLMPEFHTAGDVVVDPVRVEKFLRVDLHAIELHGEVDVVAAGHAGVAALAHYLPALHHVAFVHGELAHVPVDRLQPVAVIHHDAIAVDAERRGIDHLAVIRCLHADVRGDGEIVAEVR